MTVWLCPVPILRGLLLAGGTVPSSHAALISEYLIYFIIVSLVIVVVSSAIRERDPRGIFRESSRFFLMITVGIFLFSVVVFFLEWLFIRPLV